MKLTDNDLFLLGQSAVSAATQAANLISKYTNSQVTVHKKTTGDSLASQVVTEVDIKSQQIILQVLQPTCEIYDLALLTEETPDDNSRLEKDYFWCIDPLDGTLSFIESTPGYAVVIALVSRTGEPQIGVIYDPVEQTLYHAVKGHGVFKNSKLWKPQINETSKKTFTVYFDKSFAHDPDYYLVKDKLEELANKKGYSQLKIIEHGGAAMHACWVLENSPACYFKFPKDKEGGGSLWDFAATACIFNELGAVVTDIHGKQLDLNRADSTYMNHKGVLYASDSKIAKMIMEIYK